MSVVEETCGLCGSNITASDGSVGSTLIREFRENHAACREAFAARVVLGSKSQLSSEDNAETIRVALRREVAEFAGDIEIVLRQGEEFSLPEDDDVKSVTMGHLAHKADEAASQIGPCLMEDNPEDAAGLAIAVGGFLTLLTARLREEDGDG